MKVLALEMEIAMPYQLLDVVELIRDIPEHRLTAGAYGVIVDIYGQDKYEIEFVGKNGEALVLLALNGQMDFRQPSKPGKIP